MPIEFSSTDKPLPHWQVVPAEPMADDWVAVVAEVSGLRDPRWGAQLLWNRGIRTQAALLPFLQVEAYKPASPWEFGQEMTQAIGRLVAARDRSEKVAIWGDFDADGVTATAVLWDGLRQFFPQPEQLTIFIPNRLRESHGLSRRGLDQLAAAGISLVVTCDTGSTNPEEIAYAQTLGIEVIVTDHHTLPPERPPVVAIINPRSLPADHPMAHLSGVAVAYKLVEALYGQLPGVALRPLSDLLDLVAIGLIADLVALKGECRYLAQRGIAQLQRQARRDLGEGGPGSRPGVTRLLQLCQRSGDRPTDISFGIGPRINAVSRIYGDARFCVELLTSEDPQRCRDLAEKAELANTRRKALQKDVFGQVGEMLAEKDLSTLGVIVLWDSQWPVGILGLVAGQVAQQYGKPTILLTLAAPDESQSPSSGGHKEAALARGSARSVNDIDLYDLLSSQAHLLSSFGGHPLAAGLSLPPENLSLFAAAINQRYRQFMAGRVSQPVIQADLRVTVADLGVDLFRQLKLLEPCGMGNPVPKLLIRDVRFTQVWHQKLKDRTGAAVGYIKASFRVVDESGASFPGVWWGHYKDDLPPGRWDVIGELDYNSHPKAARYELRLIDIRPAIARISDQNQGLPTDGLSLDGLSLDGLSVNGLPLDRWLREAWLLDQRPYFSKDTVALAHGAADGTVAMGPNPPSREAGTLVLKDCPSQWQDFLLWHHQAAIQQQLVILAYEAPAPRDPLETWKTLLGLAKYLSRQQMAVSQQRLMTALGVGDRTLGFGLAALAQVGFTLKISPLEVRIGFAKDRAPSPLEGHSEAAAERSRPSAGAAPERVTAKDPFAKDPLVKDPLAKNEALSQFLAAVQEENFLRQYFSQAPVTALQAAIARQG